MIDAAALGEFIGGLIATFLASRLALYLARNWKAGPDKLLLVHVATFLVIVAIAGVGLADGGAFAPLRALSIYWLPECIWLVVDQYRYYRKTSASRPGSIPGEDSKTSNSPNSHESAYLDTADQRLRLLERLATLEAQGVLTKEEFEREKRRLLGT